MLLFAAGVIGLLRPSTVPALASPAVAWSLIATGVVLDVGAAVQLLLHRRVGSHRG